MLSSQIMKLLRVTNYNTSVLCRQKNIAIIIMFHVLLGICSDLETAVAKNIEKK